MEKSFTLSDLGNFEKLLAPKVLKIIYLFGLAAILAMCMISAVRFTSVLLPLIVFVFGVLFWRILIEGCMVFFGIYERLGEIRDGLANKP